MWGEGKRVSREEDEGWASWLFGRAARCIPQEKSPSPLFRLKVADPEEIVPDGTEVSDGLDGFSYAELRRTFDKLPSFDDANPGAVDSKVFAATLREPRLPHRGGDHLRRGREPLVAVDLPEQLLHLVRVDVAAAVGVPLEHVVVVSGHLLVSGETPALVDVVVSTSGWAGFLVRQELWAWEELARMQAQSAGRPRREEHEVLGDQIQQRG